MTAPKRELLVVAGILWRDGRFLAVQRPEGADYAGWWEFPGGKVEQGETLDAALLRELREELGVDCTHWKKWCVKRHEYPEYAVTLHFFHVTAFDGEPKALEKQGLAWLVPGDGCDLTFLPADLQLVDELLCGATGPEQG